MTGNLYQDWPVYILLGAVLFFFAYVVIKSNFQDRQGKAGRENKNKEDRV